MDKKKVFLVEGSLLELSQIGLLQTIDEITKIVNAQIFQKS